MSIRSNNLVFNIDPEEYVDLSLYRSRGGFKALEKTLSKDQKSSIEEIVSSGLRGRGGAAFPSGKKIEMVRNSGEEQRYIICNADEGEPGTFKDRFIMKHVPFLLLEGIAIAAYLAGASKGYIYVRHEYPEARKSLKSAIAEAKGKGLLGENILGSGYSLDLEIFSGAGSYLCGEETALLSSIEGKKGWPKSKPPYPTQSGLWGRPTLIHNVETLSNLPKIIEKGAAWYRSIGTQDSPGTKLISLSGDVKNKGLVEVPFGTTFSHIIERYGGGAREGRKIKAVNIGGASGVLVPTYMLDTKLEYKDCAQAGITIGSGAVFVLDDTRSILGNVMNRVRFFLHESCGRCTPCREGLRQANIILEKIISGEADIDQINTLERYTRAMQEASFCSLGVAAGNSLISSLAYYRKDYIDSCVKIEALNCREETA